jgi:hypothetical protein
MLASWNDRRQRRPTLNQPAAPAVTATFLWLLMLASFILPVTGIPVPCNEYGPFIRTQESAKMAFNYPLAL